MADHDQADIGTIEACQKGVADQPVLQTIPVQLNDGIGGIHPILRDVCSVDPVGVVLVCFGHLFKAEACVWLIHAYPFSPFTIFRISPTRLKGVIRYHPSV